MLENVSVVTAVNERYLKKFKKNMPKLATLFNAPLFVYYNGVSPDEIAEIVPQANLIEWDMDVPTDRERMLSAFILGTAKDITTKFWVKLDCDTVFNREDANLDFPKICYKSHLSGHKCAYTKTKGGRSKRHFLNVLDSWWEEKTGEKPIFPEIEGRTFRHSRIASFVCMQTLRLTQKVAEMSGGRLPIESHDTTMWFVAHRLGWRITRLNVKKSMGLSA